MRSIPAALTWEIFARGKWNLLGAFLTGNALPMLLLTALFRDGAIDPEERSMITIHVTMLLVNATMFGAVLCSAMGHPSRLSAFPAPSWVVVAWQLLPAMVAIALECLLTTVVFNVLFKVNWPLWGPALFIAVALAACVAMFWLTDKSPWYFFVLGIPVLTGGGIWFHSRYGMIFQNEAAAHMWREVTAGDALTMLAMAGISYYVAVLGAARSRCGEFLGTPEFFRWLGRLLDPAPAVGLPFRTSAAAQFWFEWQQKGWALPIIVIFALPFGFVMWGLFNRNPQTLFELATAAGALLPLGGVIVGLIFGNCGSSNEKIEMGHFMAARPMTSPELSRTMLKTAGISVLFAWIVWAAAFLVVYATLLLASVEPRPQLPRELGWWFIPLTLLGTWLGLTFMAVLGQTGRPTLIGILFCGLPALGIGLTAFSHYVLTPDARIQFVDGLIVLMGALYLVGTVWAFTAARRRSIIGTSTVWAATGAWSVLCLLLVLYWSQHRYEQSMSSVPFLVHVVGLLALVVFPIAAAPLALAWNRNR